MKWVTKQEAKRAKSNHTVKMMHHQEHHKKVAWYFKGQSLRNALLITVSGHRKEAAICGLDESEEGGQTICPQETFARMSCDDMLE